MDATNKSWRGFRALLAMGWLLGSLARGLAQDAGTPAEREVDQKQMRQIYDAIRAFEKKHGDLPDFLSDLVPEFLPNPEVLVSPVERRTGRSQLLGFDDPKLKTSYIYEFSGRQTGSVNDLAEDRTISMREWKMRQKEEWGNVIPILRCWLHDPVLNISWSGEFYETGSNWERDPQTARLFEKLGGAGPGPKGQRVLRVRVVDDAGRPVPGAVVEATNRETENGPLPRRRVTTDERGEASMGLGLGRTKQLALTASAKGLAGDRLSWDGARIETLGDEVTLRMRPTTRLGGFVRDDGGKPLAGATVRIAGSGKDEAGQVVEIPFDEVTADADGRWVSERVPVDAKDLVIRAVQPEFFELEVFEGSTTDLAGGSVSRADLAGATAVLTLRPGITVTGRVTDLQGRPLAQARVALVPVETDGPSMRSGVHLRTDAEGRYRIVRTTTGPAMLAASFPGQVLATRELNVEEGLTGQDLSLAKGREYRGRVIDESGDPLPGVTVTAGVEGMAPVWAALGLFDGGMVTGSDGTFRWTGPEAGVSFSAQAPGLKQLAMEEREGTFEIRLGKAFRLTGKVVDGETGEPIAKFRWVRGDVWGDGTDPRQVHWRRWERKEGAAGRFEATIDEREGGGAERLRFQVIAEGYRPSTSSNLTSSGWHESTFKLERGQGPSGVVKDPEGRIVEGADVALLGAGYVSMGAGRFEHAETEDTRMRTGADGTFRFPALVEQPKVAAVHPKLGFGTLDAEALARGDALVLRPFGRIEGLAKAGSKPWPDQEMLLSDPKYNEGINFNFSPFKVTTGGDGTFGLDQVPAGSWQIVRLVPMQGNSWQHADPTPVEVKPGETTKVVIGGTGRTVVGQVKFSDGRTDADYRLGHHSMQTRVARPPEGFKSAEEARAWMMKPEVQEAMRRVRRYPISFDDRGRFQVANVLPGTYDVSLMFFEKGPTDWQQGDPIGNAHGEVVVEAAEGAAANQPVDAGTLTVAVQKRLIPGAEVPDFEVKTLDEKPLKLSDFRGKYVLLDFWAVWCGPCVAELPHLKETYQAFANDPRFAFISLSLDPDLETPRKFAAKNEMKWIQGFLGEWGKSPVPQAYGVLGIPSLFLIGPDGKLIEKGMRGSAIKPAVARVLAGGAESR